MLLDDRFIIPKIHGLHRAQVSINTNKKDKTKTLVKFPDHVFIDFDCSETTFLGDGLETVAVKFVSRIDMM